MAISVDTDERQKRAAQNQALFREINESLKALNEDFNYLAPMGDWVCECADTNCVDRLEMTADEYEAVRKNPTCFVVAPADEHVLPDVEAITVQTERYWVVAKIGAGGEVARSTDPRTEGPFPAST